MRNRNLNGPNHLASVEMNYFIFHPKKKKFLEKSKQNHKQLKKPEKIKFNKREKLIYSTDFTN